MPKSIEDAITNSTKFGRDENHPAFQMDEDSLALGGSQTFSLEMDPYTSTVDRTYPSVRDYYQANCHDNSKPLQLQSGLSNYSGLKLGDDRISFSESILSATYRIPVEHLMSIDSPSKDQSKNVRKREYQAALKKVGEVEINRLERVMKDKLFQRSYATSSPFQVRKAFKFFDRENSMRTPIEGFTRALEFLGFQFSELQNLALFARYDTSFSGDIDYMTFISTAMFYAAVEPDFGQPPPTPATVITDVKDAPDLDMEEVRNLQMSELKKIFDKVDKSKSGKLDKDDFELLTMALGYNLTPAEVSSCINDMGVTDVVPFDLFFEWWTDSMGVMAIRKRSGKK